MFLCTSIQEDQHGFRRFRQYFRNRLLASLSGQMLQLRDVVEQFTTIQQKNAVIFTIGWLLKTERRSKKQKYYFVFSRSIVPAEILRLLAGAYRQSVEISNFFPFRSTDNAPLKSKSPRKQRAQQKDTMRISLYTLTYQSVKMYFSFRVFLEK